MNLSLNLGRFYCTNGTFLGIAIGVFPFSMYCKNNNNKCLEKPMFSYFSFPSPIAFYIGSWPVRWYGILYIGGFLCAWLYAGLCVKRGRFPPLTVPLLNSFASMVLWGALVGGRLGEVLLYNPEYYWANPVEILETWHGGMSFHGGLVGCAFVTALYSWRHKISFITLLNLLACCGPIGLFFGRIGNFINQELWGRPTSQPWGMVFPLVDHLPRHPSPLYEAAGEGLILFGITGFFTWTSPRVPSYTGGVFLMGYGLIRFGLEFFKEPDGVWLGLSLGQWYSLPLVIMGAAWILLSVKKRP